MNGKENRDWITARKKNVKKDRMQQKDTKSLPVCLLFVLSCSLKFFEGFFLLQLAHNFVRCDSHTKDTCQFIVRVVFGLSHEFKTFCSDFIQGLFSIKSSHFAKNTGKLTLKKFEEALYTYICMNNDEFEWKIWILLALI